MNDVIVEIKGAVVEITMNRPEKKNALTQAMYQEMSDAIEMAQQKDEIRAILLKGAAGCFTAGNDLHDFAASGQSGSSQLKNPFMLSLATCSLPVVAQVQGLAIGIGTTMLLHCDLVICDENTRFTMPFVNLALVPEFSSSYLITKFAGHRKASRWLLLGESFGAKDAEEAGLISDIVSAEDLDITTNKTLESVVSKPKAAIQQSKMLMKSDQEQILLHMDKELDIFMRQLDTPAAKEAFAAFLEKRSPDLSKFR